MLRLLLNHNVQKVSDMKRRIKNNYIEKNTRDNNIRRCGCTDKCFVDTRRAQKDVDLKRYAGLTVEKD